MPTHETINGLGLTYKGTIGISTATIPDVCKTPSPGGPVPIPYPNIATQSSLENGTTTVFARGQMIAVKGAHFGRSNGDEAGTAGGVKSSVNMKATDWITYSFDVKFDGKNACRHTDKKFHNNQNAADLCGEVDCLIPDNLTPHEYAHAQRCEDLHNEYKIHQAAARDHRATERAAIRARRTAGTATPADALTLIEIEMKRLEFLEKELEARQSYVGSDCDRIEWKGTNHPNNPEERRRRHAQRIQEVQNQINNL